MVVLVKNRPSNTELSYLLIESNRFDELFEILAIVKLDFEEAKPLYNRGLLTKEDEALYRPLHNLALLESQVDYAVVFCAFYREKDVLDPDVANDLHLNRDALVHLRLNAYSLRVA